MYIITNILNAFANRVTEFFMLKSEELPSIVALHTVEEGSLYKYKYSLPQISREEFTNWIDQLKQGNLTKFFQSDPIPLTDEKNGIKIVVGKTFYVEVLNNTKEVLLLIYSQQDEKSKVVR
jgi:hypothetical protein